MNQEKTILIVAAVTVAVVVAYCVWKRPHLLQKEGFGHSSAGHSGHGGSHAGGSWRRSRGTWGSPAWGGWWGGPYSYWGSDYYPYYMGVLDSSWPPYIYNNVAYPQPVEAQCRAVGKDEVCDDLRPVKVALDMHGTGVKDEFKCCSKYAVV